MSFRRNLITDVPGLRIGNSEDTRAISGVTVLLADRPLVMAVDIRGGGPGTRDTDAIGLSGAVEEAHGIVLSGGSAFGLSAATGVQAWLAERGIGFVIRSACVPIVPQAILFDLLNGGDKSWGPTPPYEGLGYRACDAAGAEFALGSAGAGFGATTANLRGGLGSASEHLANGLIVGALVAVNAVGAVTIGETKHFLAAPLEKDHELGGLGWPAKWPADANIPRLKGGAPLNTTLAIIATNAKLDRRAAHRLAVMAQAGLARAIYPVHTPLDGDVVFAVATGDRALADPVRDLALLGAHAANTLARAVARGVYEADAAPSGWSGPPAYRTRFGAS